MTYDKALAWLYDTQRRGIKLGLDNIRRLLGELEFEQGGRRFIHVAGTNGKGSVCAMADAVARAAGIRTGLFTSPHLIRFEERIRIDGRTISRTEVASALTRIRECVATWDPHPTFFEITTAIALRYFQMKEVELVVLETGMGGRMDATNVITPAVSVLTPIAMDHEAWLGSTLAEIAKEKAGIIKWEVPVVSAVQESEVAEVIARVAQEKKSPLTFISAPTIEWALSLPGSHQQANATLAMAGLHAAGLVIPEGAIADGLRDVHWPARFQLMEGGIVIDGAHNPAAAACLARTWQEVFGAGKATLVIGVANDKDVDGICRALARVATRVIGVPIAGPRVTAPAEIRRVFASLDPDLAVATADNLRTALTSARNAPERILVTGSLFLAGEALALLSSQMPPRASSQ